MLVSLDLPSRSVSRLPVSNRTVRQVKSRMWPCSSAAHKASMRMLSSPESQGISVLMPDHSEFRGGEGRKGVGSGAYRHGALIEVLCCSIRYKPTKALPGVDKVKTAKQN